MGSFTLDQLGWAMGQMVKREFAKAEVERIRLGRITRKTKARLRQWARKVDGK